MPEWNVWRKMVASVRSLFSGLSEHRYQDQFLRVRDEALALADSDEVAKDIEQGYLKTIGTEPNNRASEIVLMELEDFPRAVEVYQEEVKAGSVKPGAKKRLGAAAKTVLGSMNDLWQLSPHAKAAICVLKEAIDLVGGGGD